MVELEKMLKEKNAEIQRLTDSRASLQAEVGTWKAQCEQLSSFKSAITALVEPSTVSPAPSASQSYSRFSSSSPSRFRRASQIQSLSAMLEETVGSRHVSFDAV